MSKKKFIDGSDDSTDLCVWVDGENLLVSSPDQPIAEVGGRRLCVTLTPKRFRGSAHHKEEGGHGIATLIVWREKETGVILVLAIQPGRGQKWHGYIYTPKSEDNYGRRITSKENLMAEFKPPTGISVLLEKLEK